MDGIVKWCPRWRVEPLCVGSVVVMQLLGIDIKGRKTNVRNISRMDPEKVFCFRRVEPMVLNPGGSGLWSGLERLLVLPSACNGWIESVSPGGPGPGPRPPKAS